MRLVFMGTSEFAAATLRTLILAGYDIAAVVTQPDRPAGRGKKLKAPPVKTMAEEFGLTILQPEQIRDQAFTQSIAFYEPEVIVVVAYGRILPESLLNLPPLGCINLHGSILPYYRGAAPIQRAIMAGEPVVGVTTMYMDRTMDTGDMILRREMTLSGEEDYGQVSNQLADLGAGLMLETLEQLEWNSAPRVPQNHDLATYAPPLTREDERLTWQRTSRELKNTIRGLSPAPGAFTWLNGVKLKIFKADIDHDAPQGIPGQIAAVMPGQGFLVNTGDSALLITELQREGKNRTMASDFLKGFRLQVGDMLTEEAPQAQK